MYLWRCLTVFQASENSLLLLRGQDQPVDEDGLGDHRLSVDSARFNHMVNFGHRNRGGHGHYGVPIASCAFIDHVAQGICRLGFKQSEIRFEGKFKNVFLPIEGTQFLAFCEPGPRAREIGVPSRRERG